MKRIFVCLMIFALLATLFPNADALGISASGAVLINGTTGEIIWEKDSSRRLSMASTTKIMTALLLCETKNLEREIVTTREMVTVEGSSMGLLEGDTVTYRDLLYGMMLASGNDAANTTAISVGGSVERFVAMMNRKAKEIGLENTSFATPSGLDDEKHFSTAYDMALLARYALKNADFSAAAGAKSATLCYGNPPYNRTLQNHNRLLKTYEGMIGVKTGYTKKSGRCLVTAARRGNSFLIAVTLNCKDDWNSHKAMLDYGFSRLSEYELGEEEIKLPVVGGEREILTLETEPSVLALTENERQSLHKKIYLPQFVYGGINKGDKLGRVDYILGDEVLQSSEIFAAEAVEAVPQKKKSFLDYFIMIFRAMV